MGFKWVKTIKACFRDEWSGVPVYLAPWGACTPRGEAASGQLAPWGWRYLGVSCPPPWAACPPGGEDTLAWAAWGQNYKGMFSWWVVRCTGLSCTLASLPPRGWSCLWAACPLGVKIPRGILPPHPGQLAPPPTPPGWRYPGLGSLPPTQENLTELNAERFYFFKIKILIIETWENWFLHVCAYASFSW